VNKLNKGWSLSHRVSLELVSDLSLETVLERIVHMARELAGARYAALGVLNEEGVFDKFIPVGMDLRAKTRYLPAKGKGLLNSGNWGHNTIRSF
jgi:hypothetical protein